MKRLTAALLCLLTVLPLTACAVKRQPAPDETGKIRVVATFDAMAEFAKAVGGDRVTVTVIIPDGTEPHDFEPKPRDLAALANADVFVYNGLSMESWAAGAAAACRNPDLKVVEASQGAVPIRDAENPKARDDPHLWISPEGAKLEAANIARALEQADPGDKALFEQNLGAFASSLDAMLARYRPVFGADQTKSFVTGHAAFAYLCRDFGLTQQSVEDVFANGEPSPRRLVELIDFCRGQGVRTVFVEEMASPEVSRTLAENTGARLETIYTFESREDGKSYLERMRSNIEKIAQSLNG